MFSVNCKANLHLFRKALPTLNANEEGGVFLVTASIAGVGPTGSSMPYSVTKAAGMVTDDLSSAGLTLQYSYTSDEVPCGYARS